MTRLSLVKSAIILFTAPLCQGFALEGEFVVNVGLESRLVVVKGIDVKQVKAALGLKDELTRYDRHPDRESEKAALKKITDPVQRAKAADAQLDKTIKDIANLGTPQQKAAYDKLFEQIRLSFEEVYASEASDLGFENIRSYVSSPQFVPVLALRISEFETMMKKKFTTAEDREMFYLYSRWMGRFLIECSVQRRWELLRTDLEARLSTLFQESNVKLGSK